MELSDALQEQRDLFFHFVENPEELSLGTFRDSKTGEIRLGICAQNDDEDIFLIGILLLQNDSLFPRFEPYLDSPVILDKPGWFQWIKNRLWWKK